MSQRYSPRTYERHFWDLVAMKRAKITPRDYQQMEAKREFLFSRGVLIRGRSPRSRDVSANQVNYRLSQLRTTAVNYVIRFKSEYLKEDREHFPRPPIQLSFSFRDSLQLINLSQIPDHIDSRSVYAKKQR